jgi:hypothetical protein
MPSDPILSVPQFSCPPSTAPTSPTPSWISSLGSPTAPSPSGSSAPSRTQDLGQDRWLHEPHRPPHSDPRALRYPWYEVIYGLARMGALFGSSGPPCTSHPYLTDVVDCPCLATAFFYLCMPDESRAPGGGAHGGRRCIVRSRGAAQTGLRATRPSPILYRLPNLMTLACRATASYPAVRGAGDEKAGRGVWTDA